MKENPEDSTKRSQKPERYPPLKDGTTHDRSFLTQSYPSALLHTKVSLIGRAATLMCRAKGLRIQEILNWFNRNGHHTFLKLYSDQVTKIGSTMRIGETQGSAFRRQGSVEIESSDKGKWVSHAALRHSSLAFFLRLLLTQGGGGKWREKWRAIPQPHRCPSSCPDRSGSPTVHRDWRKFWYYKRERLQIKTGCPQKGINLTWLKAIDS